MSYHANVRAAKFLVDEVMPRVWKKRPDVKVILVGKDPPSMLSKMEKLDERIEVTGSVPDIRPYLRSARLSVAPIIYGAGSQGKVLEAMACGTPVVATSVAASGFEQIRMEKAALIADGAEDFSLAILRLIEDGSLCGNMSSVGLEYVKRYNDWEKITEELTIEYQQLLQEFVNTQ